MHVDVVQLAAYIVVTDLRSEVVERVSDAQSAVTSVVVVRAQRVVSTALNVERAEVQRHVVRQCKQSLGQLDVHHLTRPRPLRRQSDQTANDWINAAFLDEAPRREEGSMQRQVTGTGRLVGLVETRYHRLDQRMTEAERCARELVGRPRVDRRVVAVVPAEQALQGGLAEQLGQPVLVGDVLNDGADHLASLVVDGVTVPVRVDGQQFAGDTVVFPQPQRVHRQQTELFISTMITGLEARNTSLTRIHLYKHVKRYTVPHHTANQSCIYQGS